MIDLIQINYICTVIVLYLIVDFYQLDDFK